MSKRPGAGEGDSRAPKRLKEAFDKCLQYVVGCSREVDGLGESRAKKQLEACPGSLDLQQTYIDAVQHRRAMKEHRDGAKRFWRLVEAFVTEGRVHRPCGKERHNEISLYPHLLHSTTILCKDEHCMSGWYLCPGCMADQGKKTIELQRLPAPTCTESPVTFVASSVRVDHQSLLCVHVCDDCRLRIQQTIVPDTAGIRILLVERLGISGLAALVESWLWSPVPVPVCFRCRDV
jgi:hypothetical protein